jgi:hypothetical protein
MILMNGSVPHVRANADAVPFGLLLTPLGGLGVGTALGLGLPYGVDNGFFVRRDFPGYERLLNRIPDKSRCLFAACPDAVGDAGTTLGWFDEWEPRIRSLGFPVALVGQDGFEAVADRRAFWGRCDAFFVGGSDAFKLGPGAPAVGLIREARSLGKWVHFGRVNSVSRLSYCHRLGVDSVDGSGFVTSARDKMPRLRRYFARRAATTPLFGNDHVHAH